MAKKPKIEVDESLVKQVIAGQLPITTKVTRVIPEQIPSGTATDAIPAEPPSVPEIDTEKIPDETPSVPAAQEPRRRRTPPLSDYERMFLTPVEYGIRATLYALQLFIRVRCPRHFITRSWHRHYRFVNLRAAAPREATRS